MAGGEFAVRRGELVRAATQPVAVATQGAQNPSWGLGVKPIAVALNGRTASNCLSVRNRKLTRPAQCIPDRMTA